MQKEPLEQLNDFGKMTANIAKRISEYTLETTNEFMTTVARQWKELGDVKKMQDIAEVQAHIASETGSLLAERSQKALNMSLENFSEFSKWLEGNARFVNPMATMSGMNPSANKQSSEKRV